MTRHRLGVGVTVFGYLGILLIALTEWYERRTERQRVRAQHPTNLRRTT